MKTGVLLVNLGTPDSPSVPDVRKYLREFLSDKRVIDIHPIARWLLVNLIIAPIRAPKSAKLYREIWTGQGSPLTIHGLELTEKLQAKLGNEYVVAFGMRYQNPSLRAALDVLRKALVRRIVVVPLYPQYASSTTGSSTEVVMQIIAEWEVTPELHFVGHFHHRADYLDAVAATAMPYDHQQYDHVVFSFHGIPQRHIRKSDANYGSGQCAFGACCETLHDGNRFCYRANCVQTARGIAQRLGISPERYTISFQSRLGRDPWIQPYSDHVVEDLGKQGKKKLLMFSPAFVADCLETLYEVGTEYNELFQEHGGEKVQLVPSLNSNLQWVDVVSKMVTEKL